jgi:hypothetical protein
MKRWKIFTFVILKLFCQREKKNKTRQEKYIKQKLNAVSELGKLGPNDKAHV